LPKKVVKKSCQKKLSTKVVKQILPETFDWWILSIFKNKFKKKHNFSKNIIIFLEKKIKTKKNEKSQ